MTLTTDGSRLAPAQTAKAADYPQDGRANGLEIYVEQVGRGPDVLLIGGLGDTVESWQFQLDGLADSYRLTAFDNRGAGRTAMPEGPVSVEAMADDAAARPARARHPLRPRRGLLRRQRHRPGAGAPPPRSRAQPRAAEHLAGGRTPTFARGGASSRWLVEIAPSERAFLEGFFL